MKIIVHKKNETICYVQLRDLLYLAYGKRNAFRELANKYMDEFKQMVDFVKVEDPEMIKIIEKREDIIDYDAFCDHTIDALTHLLISKNLFCTSDESKRRVEHETQDIQDIISLKKGELEYSIPLVPDDRIVQNINGYIVKSTNCDNKFFIKYETAMFPDFVYAIDIIKRIAIDKGMLKSDVEYAYKTTEIEGGVVLSFTPVVMKKQNVFQKLFNKKRTDN